MNFMAPFHGSISETGEVVLLILLTGCCLFVCALLSSLVCNAVRYETVPLLTEHNGALLTAGIPGAVVGN